ncbi:MAG: hypothetical protein J5605_05550 [Bacteroidales bacterium]|nr:hypothetical protein [Bacteroidales bacterium]
MKKVFLFGMAVLAIGIFASCEKTEDNNTPTIVHNELYQTYWEGDYTDSGQNGEYEWHDLYLLKLDFFTDTTVSVYGAYWHTDNAILKGYHSSKFKDTLKYAFSSGEGAVYGSAYTYWYGDETQLQYDENTSLLIRTRFGLKKMTRKKRKE